MKTLVPSPSCPATKKHSLGCRGKQWHTRRLRGKAAAVSGGTWPLLVRGPTAHWSADLLALPNVSAAGAADRVGRLLFSQLLFADWTGFGHYIRHSRDL